MTENEEYPNAAMLVAFANSPVCKPDAKFEKLENERNEMLSQLRAIQTAAERETKRIEGLEKALEARKRRARKVTDGE